jgi:hypothetical protein
MGGKVTKLRKKFFTRKTKLGGPNWFAQLDEARAPNVKQYLRGLRNYYILSHHIHVSLRYIISLYLLCAIVKYNLCRETL